MVEETKLFIKYLVEGLKNPMTELESSKCIDMVCEKGKPFLYEFTGEII